MSSEMYPRQRRFLGALLRVPSQAIVQEIHNAVVAAGYTDVRQPHMVVFQYIEREGSRPTELAERANMTKQAMGYLLDYLEERDYVERTPDADDGRMRIVRLTARGWGVMLAAREAMLKIEAEWGAYLGDERMDQLIRILQDLAVMLGEPITF
ncbi:MAG: MarR family winged helix-turn-helix transcriptional regulator [Anaerolineae bacterium]